MGKRFRIILVLIVCAFVVVWIAQRRHEPTQTAQRACSPEIEALAAKSEKARYCAQSYCDSPATFNQCLYGSY